jgi:hypothetical protein
MRRLLPNLALGTVVLAIPIVAQLSRPAPNTLGLDVLLYEPFEFAFALLALALFVALNVVVSRICRESSWRGVALGAVIAVGWFEAAFLFVAQLHISMGGKP